jgi:hypothetical protein
MKLLKTFMVYHCYLNINVEVVYLIIKLIVYLDVLELISIFLLTVF